MLACDYDMIMQTKAIVDWERIKKLRADNMLKNNIKENQKRIEHECKVRDKVLIVESKDERSKAPKLNFQTEGPHTITRIHRLGTVTILRDTYEERINIRRLRPFTNKA